jgi:F-type H+-transporting ATPase subunit delta
MAEKSTIARPYAKAVFELAFEQKKLAAWSEVLAAAAAIVADERVAKLLTSPRVTPAQLADFVIELVGQALKRNDGLDEQARNFMRTLAVNRRLGLLPEIVVAYERLRAESENSVDVTVTSAVPLDEQQRQQYAAALKKRLKREVRLHSAVDPKLLGGAVLRADDLVIDGSLRGRLERLSHEVAA